MGFLATVLGAVTGPVATYMTRRMELKAQEHENQMKVLIAQGDRQAALQSQGLTADANWEMEFAKQAATSWKDEYTLLVVSIPAVLAFVPGCAKLVAQGFVSLTATPLWYQIMLCSIFFATYGIRYWRRTQSDS